ncbi:MAG: condensation domain-containing protein, partial [Polyangiaceae bacterium]|nr:condensation domain-containing protein [Polyangiaceae bacterium]
MTPRDQTSPLSSIKLGRYKSLVDILRLRSERQGDELLYRFLATGDVDGPADEWSYARLDRAARAIAAGLGAGATGERVLLLFPPGLDFVAALMGCLYAGAIAVPTYPPDPGRLDRTLPRLRGIAADCGARLVLTTSLIKSMAEVLLPQAPELSGMAWIAVDDLSEGAGCNWQPPAAQADGVALLQYTSGSTGAPKGVVLTHTQILHNERLIRQGFGHETCVVGVGWLPVFHDMGLIGNVLQPLYHGFPCTLMSPLAFLQRPLRWLQAISRFGATTSGGPNFAYELCIKKVPNAALAELDLRSWAVAFNGAEPTRSETMQRFAERFAPCGFQAEAFYACYGLAEATLIVSGGRRGEGLRTRSLDAEALARGRAVEVAPGTKDTARTLVSVGRPGEGLRVVVVDPQTGAPRAPGAVGEIWVAGSSVGVGYWGRAEESAATFGARLPSGEGPFLRTGDLGFFAGDELFVTGRLKDLLILRGRNVYPQDVELTVERAHPAVRPGCVAAFAIDEGGEERLAVVAEVGEVGGEKGVGAVADAVRRAVAEEHAVSTHLLALIPPRSLPKTSSGKVQRGACRQALLAGELEVLARSVAPAAPADAPRDDARAALEGAREEERLGLLERLLRDEIARRLGADPSTLDARAHLASLGLDSLGGLELQEALETALGVTLPATFLWQSATLGEGAAALEAAWSRRSAAPASGQGAAPTPGPVEGEWPLSPGQFRLWFLERLMPQTPLYHVQFGLRMRGPLDARALDAALNELVARHAALRTVFREVGGEPRQLVRPTGRVELERLDLRAEPPAEREAALERHALEAGRALFDLEQGPLMRASLARCGDEDHVLLMTQHHLITDGWSIRVLARELSEAYAAIVAGGRPAPAPPLQYPDFARWQLARRPALRAQRAFWAEQLRGMPVLELRTDLPRPRGASVEGATVRFALPRPLVDALRALGRREGGTLYVTLLAAFAALLHRYSGQEDFGVGAVTAQRERPAVRGLVGFLTNTLAIRCQFGGEPTFAEFVRRTRDRVREALLASELPFEDVVAASVGARGADYTPLFRASFLLERLPAVEMPAPSSRWTPELRAPDGAVPGTAKFDLSLALAETEGGLDGALEYRADLFHVATVRRFAG